MDINQLSQAIVLFLTPYIPYFIKGAKIAGEELLKALGKDSGSKAVAIAEGLWGKIQAKYKQDEEVKAALTMVGKKPKDKGRQQLLAQILAERLEANKGFARELEKAIGGKASVLSIIAEKGGKIRNIVQYSEGDKTNQSVKARGKGSTVNGVLQIFRKKK